MVGISGTEKVSDVPAAPNAGGADGSNGGISGGCGGIGNCVAAAAGSRAPSAVMGDCESGGGSTEPACSPEGTTRAGGVEGGVSGTSPKRLLGSGAGGRSGTPSIDCTGGYMGGA